MNDKSVGIEEYIERMGQNGVSINRLVFHFSSLKSEELNKELERLVIEKKVTVIAGSYYTHSKWSKI